MTLEQALGFLGVFILGVVACTATPAGLCLRMAVLMPFYWTGLVDEATLRALVLS